MGALSPGNDAFDVRPASLDQDLDAIRRLWLEYLTWGNDEMEARHGFRLPVAGAVEQDIQAIAKFQPPDGAIVLAFDGPTAIGIGCLQRIGATTAEIKRMFVEPAYRGVGLGRRLVEALLSAASERGYQRVRLDSPDFMTAAHTLYRRVGFVITEPYPESEIPEALRSHWLFMERPL